ncbi:DUF4377 domain-containing protein [Lysobacter sp. A421]
MKPLVLLFPLMLVACSAPTPPDAAPPPVTNAAIADATAGQAVDSALLGRYHWQLDQATDADGQRIDALLVRPEHPVQLDFADSRIQISNTCNSMSGGFSIDGGQLQVDRLAQTMMACADPALAALDDAVGDRLADPATIASQQDGDSAQLTLTTTSGDVLVFVGKPTAETRYGSEGEQVFLEVAAQTKPCNHPLIPDKSCLQVRERTYDENGLVVGTPGEWEPLYQDIEGYTHEPGIRNVLRLKQFTIANPPADGSSIAYVLDMVVESERVTP